MYITSISGVWLTQHAVTHMCACLHNAACAAAVFAEEVWSATVTEAEAAEVSTEAAALSSDAGRASQSAAAASAAQLGERIAVHVLDDILICSESAVNCLAVAHALNSR